MISSTLLDSVLDRHVLSVLQTHVSREHSFTVPCLPQNHVESVDVIQNFLKVPCTDRVVGQYVDFLFSS